MVTLQTDRSTLSSSLLKVFREDASTTVLGSAFHISQIQSEKHTCEHLR